MEKLKELLGKLSFFEGIKPEWLDTIAGCGKQIHLKPNEHLFHEGDAAEAFYIVRHGEVALEIFAAGRGGLTIQTVRENDIIGWSWIIPPYKSTVDARAKDDVTLICLDGRCLRGKCEENQDLGYDLLKRFSAIFAQRLQATHLRLIDMYGEPEGSPTGNHSH